ncbi:tetratricopeptide repeat protein [Flagellimonas sp.]|uniref:tetratricopeptide repeat protein n=1 Tax=Flagellimonas sp. TaxID=2058762 RepID=UPI003F49E841
MNPRVLHHIWLILIVYSLLFGLCHIEDDSTAILTLPNPPTKIDSLQCHTQSSRQFDRLTVLSSEEKQRIEEDIANNLLKSAIEEDGAILVYLKFLWINGNHLRSKEVLQDLLRLGNELAESPFWGWVNYNLGEIYYLDHYVKNQKGLNDSWSHHRRAKTIFQNTGDSTGLAKSLSRLGVLHERANNPDSASYYYNYSITIAKKVDYNIGLSRPYTHLGFVSQRDGDTLQARTYIENALRINMECKNYEELPFSLVNTSRLLYSDDLDSAKGALLEAIEVSKSIGFKLAEIHALYHLSHMAKEAGDKKLAITSCKEVIELASEVGYSIYLEPSKKLMEELMKG